MSDSMSSTPPPPGGGSYTPPPLPPPPPPLTGSVPPQQPADIGMLRTFFIISLVVNAIATLAWLVSTILGGMATCGIGCLLIVIPVVTGAALTLDAMALQKFNRPDAKTGSFLRTAAIMDIVAGAVGMSAVPLVMGILCLIQLGKPESQNYYGGLQ